MFTKYSNKTTKIFHQANNWQNFKILDTDGNETTAPTKNYKVTFNTAEKGVYAFYVSSGAYNYDYSGGGTGINNESNTFTFEYSSKPILKSSNFLIKSN